MASVQAKSFDQPDEVFEFDDGKSRGEFVTINDNLIVRSRLAPGWSWDEFVKPMTDGWTTCPEHHQEYVIAGQIKYLMEDGSETTVGPGTYVDIPPGHRAWVEGDEECVLLDWGE
jgi:hypothetical protein